MLKAAISFCSKNSSKIVPLVMAFALSACATTEVKTGPVFFPSPPNPPRIQYLTGISDSTDVEGKKSGFSLVVTGRDNADDKRFIYKPYGITVHKGKIYVCDIAVGNVVIIDLATRKFEYLKGNFNVGKLKKPANSALDKDGNLYVVDTLRREVVVYNAGGDYLRAFGKEEDMKPSDVAVDGENVYVLDIQKGRNQINVFDRNSGRFKGSIGKMTPEQEGLAVPTNFTLDSKGFLYVTNAGTGKVMKLDKDGHLLFSFGELGDIVGKFSRPKGIAVDDAGRIYVVDGGAQNVQIFNETGRILAFFGDPGLLKGSLNLPVSVAVTRDNLEYFQKLAAPGFILEAAILITNQYGSEKVSVYGLGRMQGSKEEEAAQPAGTGAKTGSEPAREDGKK